jgi:hypothetical protein
MRFGTGRPAPFAFMHPLDFGYFLNVPTERLTVTF